MVTSQGAVVPPGRTVPLSGQTDSGGVVPGARSGGTGEAAPPLAGDAGPPPVSDWADFGYGDAPEWEAELADQPPVVPDPPLDPLAGLGWEALARRVRECQDCALAGSRTQTVFGVGDHAARWMLIGEAPGAEEDRQGEPFVGRAGRLLDAMLAALDLRREQVYIANVLKCRPPGNRDPRPEEVAACEGYLRRQITLLQPGIILCVGRVAAQQLLASSEAMGRLRGRVHHWRPGPAAPAIPVVATYHPAYLLRAPAEKAKAWADLCLARRALRAVEAGDA